MVAFRKILVPTDFEEPAQQALNVAIGLAEKFDSAITLEHVYTIPVYGYGEGLYWPIADLEREARKALDAELAKAKSVYPTIEAVLAMGAPSDQILAIAKERGVDLIVMGTHGRRGLSRVLLGSVAERVVRLSSVPVLTISAGKAKGQT